MARENNQQIETIRGFLSTETTLVLSTISAEGAPHATPLFYLPGPDLDLTWLSSTTSQHSLHIARNPSVSVAVFHATDAWQEIRGVQMTGSVDCLTGSARQSILEEYCRRFRLGPELSTAADQSSLYRFHPRWIRYIDNSRGFGYKFEIEL